MIHTILLTATISFATLGESVPESVGTHNIGFVMTEPATQTISITFKVTGGSAGPADYFFPTEKVAVFQPGQTSTTVPIVISDSNIYTPAGYKDVGIILQLVSPTGAAWIGQPAGYTLTIVDNDGPPVISFEQPTSTCVEGTTCAVGVVTTSTIEGYGVGANYATVGGNAVNGSDYTLNPGTVRFFPRDTRKVINIPITADGLDEWDETITVGLVGTDSGGSGVPVSLHEPIQHTVTVPGDGPAGFCTAPPPNGNCLVGPPNPPLQTVWCCR